jgi:transposase
LTDALGNPLKFILTGGQGADITQAKPLLEGVSFEKVLADKGYDSDELVQAIQDRGAEAVIPPRSCRNVQREYDRHTYQERHGIECFFNKLKQYRRIATRYEKTRQNYLAMVAIAACIILLA